MDADYADDLTFLINTPAQAEFPLYHQGQAAIGIGLHMNLKNRVHMF